MNNKTINFFWKGNNFTYLNRLCILSHISVGHDCRVWLSGDTPNSKYWINDTIANIKSADDIFDISGFLKSGGNLKTGSDLWRFHFLYKFGGIYCDTDAMAVARFPDDDWILCSSLPNHPKERLSIGVLASPPGEEVFLNCIKNIKNTWGNVSLFAEEYHKIFNNTNSTHDDKLFYPYTWKEWNTLFKDINIPDVYSIHLYNTMLERNNKLLDKEEYMYDKNTLIYKLIEKFDKEI